jgi:hypothetical protein
LYNIFKNDDQIMRRREMPVQSGFRKGLIQQYGAVHGSYLAADVDARLEALLAYAPTQPNAALRMHVNQKILPGVALYRCLLAQGLPADEAVAAAEKLLAVQILTNMRLARLAAWLPNSYAIFRFVSKQQLRQQFPPEGWQIQMRRDTPDCLEFDITRCIYLETITALGHPELVPAFCRLDSLLGEAMASYARFERSGTLGMGAACCDFSYRKV